MERRIPDLAVEALDSLAKDPDFLIERQSKDFRDALRCYPRNPADGEIDWRESNVQILRLINASSEPFSGAFCQFKGEKMIIWRANLFQDNEIYLAVPGQVAAITSEGVVVTTGEGKLLLTEVEVAGKRGHPNLFINSLRSRLT